MNKINIQNPVARLILGKLHSLTSIVRTISSTYTYSTSHSYDNISADLKPSFLYKFGLQESPIENPNELSDTSLTNNNFVMLSSHNYSTDIRI